MRLRMWKSEVFFGVERRFRFWLFTQQTLTIIMTTFNGSVKWGALENARIIKILFPLWYLNSIFIKRVNVPWELFSSTQVKFGWCEIYRSIRSVRWRWRIFAPRSTIDFIFSLYSRYELNQMMMRRVNEWRISFLCKTFNYMNPTIQSSENCSSAFAGFCLHYQK